MTDAELKAYLDEIHACQLREQEIAKALPAGGLVKYATRQKVQRMWAKEAARQARPKRTWRNLFGLLP